MYPGDEPDEKEIRKTRSVTQAQKRIKHVGSYPAKTSRMKKPEKRTQIGRISAVKATALPKLTHTFRAVPIKTPAAFPAEVEKTILNPHRGSSSLMQQEQGRRPCDS